MCWGESGKVLIQQHDVSVAGCLGYDVLVFITPLLLCFACVSVAGCLGYDVLVRN